MNEDPTDDDIDRFSAQTGHCPDCGEEIWDEAWQCPHCDAVVEGRILRDRPDPAGRLISKRAVLVLAGGLVLLLLLLQIR